MNTPLHFRPLYQERVWGGRNFESKLGRTLPENKVIGESWEVVDRSEAQSVVAEGPHAGKSLRELIREDPVAIMGEGWDPERPFPILVKWLDCQERLSLQVHPPADVAPRLGGEPKTENWYVADATEGAGLIVGLRRGVTREAFEKAIHDSTLESLVHRFPVSAGDSILVQSGRLHAIDAGNLILEIQQNSDTTYRVYDWGRVGLDGKPRQLHIEESLACIDFNDFEPEPLRATPGDVILAECAEFRIRKLERPAGAAIDEVAGAGVPRLLHVVRGAVVVATDAGNHSFSAGDNILLPASLACSARAESDAVVLVTDEFAGA
ncbi:MAG: mannose-6-phosphate isomerase [Verrucomicrobia bacterium]|nr:MAG: mannose-6-phosphate isomerase [Verrucomicrobiota bacterium]